MTNTIAPIGNRFEQVVKDENTGINRYNYMYGEVGLSVHMTDNAEEILMGAPGIWNWKGSVIRYRSIKKKQQQNLWWNTNIKQPPLFEHQTDIINPNNIIFQKIQNSPDNT